MTNCYISKSWAVYITFIGLVCIWIPLIPGMDIVQTKFSATVRNSQALATHIRFDIWSACIYDSQDHRTCLRTTSAHNVTLTTENKTDGVVVRASWIPGLVLHFLAAGITFVVFLILVCLDFVARSHREDIPVWLTLVLSFVVVLFTVPAFGIDINHFTLIQHEMARLGGVTTQVGPGFWLTLVSLCLPILFFIWNRYLLWKGHEGTRQNLGKTSRRKRVNRLSTTSDFNILGGGDDGAAGLGLDHL